MIHLDKLSVKQLFCLVVLTQVGVHVLTIPYEESRHSGYDAWISILIAGAIAQAVILIVYRLGNMYADRPLPHYMSAIAGKPLGAVLNVAVAAYCAESSLIVLISYADVISRWVLFTTPWFVITGLTLAIAAYIASSPLRSVAVVTQSVLVMFAICFAIVVVSGMGQGDWRHFLPVGTHGIGAFVRDAFPALWAFAGFELLLYVFPYVSCRRQKDIAIAMSAANGFTTFFYALIAVLVTYNFSESQLNAVPEPMIFILRQFKWPVVQNLDIVFMTLWLAVTSVTVYVYLFLSARYLAFVPGKEIRRHPLLVWILAGVCFVIGLWGANRQWMLRFSAYHHSATAIMVDVLPILLYAAALIRRKAGTR